MRAAEVDHAAVFSSTAKTCQPGCQVFAISPNVFYAEEIDGSS